VRVAKGGVEETRSRHYTSDLPTDKKPHSLPRAKLEYHAKVLWWRTMAEASGKMGDLGHGFTSPE